MPAAIRVEPYSLNTHGHGHIIWTSFRRILCFMSQKWDIGGVVDFLCVWHPTLQLRIINFGYVLYRHILLHWKPCNHFFKALFEGYDMFHIVQLPTISQIQHKKTTFFQKSQPRCQSRRGFHLGKYDTCRSIFANATLQGINISHLGKRKIIFKMPFLGDMLVSWRVIVLLQLFLFLTNRYSNFTNLSFLLQVVVPWVCLKRFINFVVDRNIAHSNKFTNHPLAWPPKEERQLPKSSMFSSWNTLKSTCS